MKYPLNVNNRFHVLELIFAKFNYVIWMLEFILADLLADLPPLLTSYGQDEFKFGRSTAQNKQQQFQYVMVYIYYGIYLAAILDSSRKEFIFISE